MQEIFFASAVIVLVAHQLFVIVEVGSESYILD
jgi:hypothetical protein